MESAQNFNQNRLPPEEISWKLSIGLIKTKLGHQTLFLTILYKTRVYLDQNFEEIPNLKLDSKLEHTLKSYSKIKFLAA